uniref:Homeobox protein Wariai-like n=1 Tax=Saccoglossus kowalevskii TaxID=10224 RepID=A0ABM0MII7_SACKO|nr:PREDICTED: homeobox protein Wariai-like [Saccoglossus kowalevskii]
MEVGVRDNTGKFTESFEVFAKLPSGTLTSVIVQFETKVRDLKSIIEFRCGIPSQLQQLSYKNHYELSDKDTLRALCVIPGVQVPVNFLHGYEDLIEAALSGNTKGVLDDLKKRYDNTNIRQRKIAALFVAAQRGYHFLVERLVKDGTEVNEQTPTGRTPLHIACAMGNNGCIDLLLEAGACLDIQDYYGQTPIEVAFNCKQKEAERRLHLFRRTIKGPTIYRRKVDQPRERAMSSWAWTPRFRSRSVPPAALMREISLTPGPELMISQCKIEESTSANKSVNFDESTIVSEDSSDISSRPGSEESGESSKENIESTPRSVKSGGISHQEWLVKKQIEGRTKSRDGTCSLVTCVKTKRMTIG